MSNSTATYSARPIRNHDDDFFQAGNELVYQYSDVTISYVEEDESERNNYNQQEEEEPLVSFQCSMPHCYESFESIHSFEAHYEKNHIFQCSQPKCKLAFPNEHLLDLHIQESHDAYFQTMLEHYLRARARPRSSNKMKMTPSSQHPHNSGNLYKCLVESCNEKFQNDIERCHHLNAMHAYPIWFRFHSRAKKKNSSRSRQRSRKKVHVDIDQQGQNTTSIPNDENYQHLQIMKDDEKKERRWARRKAKNKNIPCRFFHSKRGCRKGDKCIFLHEDMGVSEIEMSNSDCAGINGDSYGDKDMLCEEIKDIDIVTDDISQVEVDAFCSSNAMDIDENIDELATQIGTKANISLPEKISFGRRRRI